MWPAAICASVALTVTRPAQATLVPLLTSSRAELTAVNVLSSWVESVSVLAGAGLAGGLIALGGPGTAVVAFALASVLSTAATAPLARLPLRTDVVPGGSASHTPPALDPAHARAGLGPLLGLLAVQYLVVGLLDVAMVALAIGVPTVASRRCVGRPGVRKRKAVRTTAQGSPAPQFGENGGWPKRWRQTCIVGLAALSASRSTRSSRADRRPYPRG